MRAAIEHLPPGGMVKFSAKDFLKLAALIERLAARRGCGDDDCFRQPNGGFRWWVPLPEVERDRAELAVLRRNQRATDIETLLGRSIF